MYKEYFNLSLKDTLRSWTLWKPSWEQLGLSLFYCWILWF